MEKDIIDNENYLIEDGNDYNYNIKNTCTLNILNEEKVDNKYVFNIDKDIDVTINIFDASNNINRNIIVNLNGENSKIDLNISNISLGICNYDVDIFHNKKNTTSNTIMHGIQIDNNIINFRNNGHIIKNSQNSTLNQDNKIIIMKDNNSKIEPNLFIDEYDVKASHGAYVGKFKEEDIFYLQSRGISLEKANKLLILGFLLGEFKIDDNYKEKLENIINKYWR